ncbi:MAG: hypothetical protein SEPTF4163_001856 [Sporothrix epigloea]
MAGLSFDDSWTSSTSDGSSNSAGLAFPISKESRQQSGITDAMSIDVDKNIDQVLPLLEPPGEFEVWAYYWAMPSRPHLLGRTTSGAHPWWRLVEPPVDSHWGPTANLDRATVCGPVGPHPIHTCWRKSTLNRVRTALSGLPWTSIDVLRIGRTELREYERPVIVWVGVSASAMEKIEAPWALIASKLRAVRAALDADNLTDVECEMRESDIVRTANAGPRLFLPPRERDQYEYYGRRAELSAIQAVSTALGRAITSSHCESSIGTLGIYLVSECGEDDEDRAGTAWALTCNHVAFPGGGNIPTGQSPAILISAKQLKNKEIYFVNNLISKEEEYLANAKPLPSQTPDEFVAYENRLQRLAIYRQLQSVLSSFQATDAARTLGHVHHSPPISIQKAGTEDAFTRDWALVTLDRQKFPDGYEFENVVDLQSYCSWAICRLLNKHIERFAESPAPPYEYPTDNLLRLQGVAPVADFIGPPPSSKSAEGDGRRNFVMKRGSDTGLTAGIVLDIESVTRQCFEGVEEESYELAVIHLSNPHEFGHGLPYEFSGLGDSGAVVFDLQGRIVGMLTSGSGWGSVIDCTYVTPLAKLQPDIEQTLGTRLRIP